MPFQPQLPAFVYNFNLAKDKVDKGSNREPLNTAGSGPRPPQRSEYPDHEKKSKVKRKEKK